MTRPTKAVIDQLCKDLVDRGLLVEAGWKSLQLAVLPVDASPVQVSETRMAFFAGAQHLFASIIGILEEDREPTENDLRRMSAIHDELERFAKELQLRASKPEGSA